MHLCILIKVDKVSLKGVNQGNIESVVSSMHVTNSDKNALSQLFGSNWDHLKVIVI